MVDTNSYREAQNIWHLEQDARNHINNETLGRLQDEVARLQGTGNASFIKQTLGVVQDCDAKNHVPDLIVQGAHGQLSVNGQERYNFLYQSLMNTHDRNDFSPWKSSNSAVPRGLDSVQHVYDAANAAFAKSGERNSAVLDASNRTGPAADSGDGAGYHMTKDGYGVISLNHSIDQNALSVVQDALSKNKDAKGWVLDMRGNQSGSVADSMQLASMFMNDGTVMTMHSRLDSDPRNPQYRTDRFVLGPNSMTDEVTVPGRTVRQELQGDDGNSARLPYLVNGKPVVVLTDGGTSGGAEAVAGALRDNHLAMTIGSKTRGGGSTDEFFRTMQGNSGRGGVELDSRHALAVEQSHVNTPNGDSLASTAGGIAPIIRTTDLASDADRYTADDDAYMSAMRQLQRLSGAHNLDCT